MGGHGNRGDGNAVLECEWVGMGMIRWKQERNGNKKVIPAHIYTHSRPIASRGYAYHNNGRFNH